MSDQQHILDLWTQLKALSGNLVSLAKSNRDIADALVIQNTLIERLENRVLALEATAKGGAA